MRMIEKLTDQKDLIAKALHEESCLRSKKDFHSLSKLAVRFYGLGLEEKARTLLLEISSFGDNRSPIAHKELAKILYSEGDSRRAAYHTTQAIIETPISSITLESFRYLAKDPQVNADCLEMLETIVNEEEASWRQLMAYAFLLKMQGNYDLASKYVARATDDRYPTTSSLKTNRIEPSFIVAGAMKSGTTSFFDGLASHPRIMPPILKELEFDFFRNDQVPREWYLSHYQRERMGSTFMTGEANPGICVRPFAKRIKEVFPKIKLIFILRNPVDRAISHYYHMRKLGFESRSIEESLLISMDTLEPLVNNEISLEEKIKTFVSYGADIKTNHYLFFGIYDVILNYWRSYFPDEQILVVPFDELIKDQEKLLNRAYDFLNLEQVSRTKKEILLNKGHYTRKDEGEVERKLQKFYQTTINFMQQHYDFSW